MKKLLESVNWPLLVVFFLLVPFLLPIVPVMAADPPVYTTYNITYNPNAHPESTSVDGYIQHTNPAGNKTWAALISSTAGGSFSGGDTDANANGLVITSGANPDEWTTLLRSILLFDTSAIPDNATISAATLGVYTYGKTDALTITPDLNIYETSPASNTAIASSAANFGSFNTTPLATAIAYAGINGNGYTTFTLNSDGRSFISKTGITKLGIRNANYDAADSAPAWSASKTTSITFCFAEYASKPRLIITYTAPVATVSTTSSTTEPGQFTLIGSLDSLAGASNATVYFQFGTISGSYGYTTPGVLKTSTGSFNATATDLPTFDGTVYYRTVVENIGGTSYGEQLTLDSRPRIEAFMGVKSLILIVPTLIIVALFSTGVLFVMRSLRELQGISRQMVVGVVLMLFGCVGFLLLNFITQIIVNNIIQW